MTKEEFKAGGKEQTVCVCVYMFVWRRKQPWSEGKITSWTSLKAEFSITVQNVWQQTSSNRLNNSFVFEVLRGERCFEVIEAQMAPV